MIKATKNWLSKYGSSATPNYFIIDELNPDAWGLMAFQ
jgi:hypothetical protein